jgi:hypothetical protein
VTISAHAILVTRLRVVYLRINPDIGSDTSNDGVSCEVKVSLHNTRLVEFVASSKRLLEID